MSDLGDALRRRIAAEGPLTVAAFMSEVLVRPQSGSTGSGSTGSGSTGSGYYMRGDPFGARGDFVTAPEISQMFGELLGLWCVERWQAMGAPAPVRLVELGPGRGTLMRDALRAARVVPPFMEALDLDLVDVSPALREMQADRLHGYAPRWHDDLGTVPDGPTLLLANEFFDALPVRQFVREGRAWRERFVTRDERGDGFAFALGPPAPGELIPEHLEDAASGELVEVSPAREAVAGEIARRLHRFGGAALLLDYGASDYRGGATLQAVRAHRSHDVLEAPGSADLTAHVDFRALAASAEAAGAAVHGPVEQGVFLPALGLGARAARLAANADERQRADIESAYKRLTDPAEMGSLFKVVAFTDPRQETPPGFAEAGRPVADTAS